MKFLQPLCRTVSGGETLLGGLKLETCSDNGFIRFDPRVNTKQLSKVMISLNPDPDFKLSLWSLVGKRLETQSSVFAQGITGLQVQRAE